MSTYDATPNARMHHWGMHKNSRLGWTDGLCEMIDNAFDATAHNVVAKITTRAISISDDGRGVEDMTRVAHQTAHGDSEGGIGRYGVGLKDFACWLWGEMNCYSRHEGSASRYCIRWEDADDFRKFPLPTNLALKAASQKIEFGNTTFRFTEIRRRPPKDPKSLIKKLGERYSPVLRSGKSIEVHIGGRSERCEPIEFPPMEPNSYIEEEFTVSKTRKARLRFGIIKEGKKPGIYGMGLIFSHRMMDVRTSFGCNGYTNTRVYGELEYFGEGWELDRNKRGMDDAADGVLEEMVFKKIEELLKQASQQAEYFDTREIEDQVNARLLQGVLLENHGRPRRDPRGDVEGSIAPKGTDRDVRSASRVATDPDRKPRARNRRPSPRIQMQICELDEDTIGIVDLPGGKVTLNKNASIIYRAHQNRNIDALHLIVIALYCHQRGESQLDWLEPGYGEKIMSMLAWEEEQEAD